MAKILKVRSTRRQFLAASSRLTLAGACAIASPYISRASDRPRITHGIQSGDIHDNSGLVWARADRPARMVVEASTTESFATVCDQQIAEATSFSDFTARAVLQNLPPGQDIFYRVRFEDITSPTLIGEIQTGHFRTAPAAKRTVSFIWSGDCAGQGWGIDEARGGIRTYATMLRNAPDFFIHCGDSVYADEPIPPEQEIPGGGIWKNVVTESKSRVAENLSDFRGNYKYFLSDRNVRAFNAQVPIIAQWDDHEVADDWCLGQSAERDRELQQLEPYGRRAFREFMPIRTLPQDNGRIYRRISYGPSLDVFLIDMRSYRTALGGTGDEVIIGTEQLAWLKAELRSSKATWKVISTDQPMGVATTDTIGQGDGPAVGRELEVADLLSFIKRERIVNTVWITADLHYTAALYFDPNVAVFQDFDPFWGFISGPLHAGTWTPRPLDNTFGPRLVYQKACSAEQGENMPPCLGMQFFGHVSIDGDTEVMTVTLKDVDDHDLWSTRIEPRRDRFAAIRG